MTQADQNPMDVAEPQATAGPKPCAKGKHGKATADGADGWKCPTCGAKLCGAKLRKKPGRRCNSDKLMPSGRCRLHGGKTPAGIGSANWKHGGRSKHRWTASLPKTSLADRFEDALHDPTLASLKQALALNDALLTGYLSNLKDTGRPLTVAQEKRVLALMDSQRKLAGDEARRERDLGVVVSREQFMHVVNVCMALFVEFVVDLKQRAEIQRRLQSALLTTGQPGVTVKGDD